MGGDMSILDQYRQFLENSFNWAEQEIPVDAQNNEPEQREGQTDSKQFYLTLGSKKTYFAKNLARFVPKYTSCNILAR